MTDEQLLGEIEYILRTVPPRKTIRHQTDENYSWFGRAAAALEEWDFVKGGLARLDIDKIQDSMARTSEEGYRKTITTLHQAKNDLRMRTTGPLSIAVSNKMVFHYFEEIRKIIEQANKDILFVDPYLDAEFISIYPPNIKPDVKVRLLAREKLSTLLPAVKKYMKQRKQSIEVRSASGFHDRYVFIDDSSCYQSGASFKDGARNSPTTITQITDAFPAMHSTYQGIWQKAKVEV